MKTGHTLVLGGARSGKSFFAERLALGLSKNPAYIATAGRGDAEMTRRIKQHRKRRGKNFVTFEEPLKLAETIEVAARAHKIILVDCLTLWLSNLMFSNEANPERFQDKWTRLSGSKTRPNKDLEPGFGSTKTKRL